MKNWIAPWTGYGVAALSTGCAALIIWLSSSFFAAMPATIFVIPVALSAYIGGLGPSMVATIGSTAAADYFFFSSGQPMVPAGAVDGLRLTLLALALAFVALLTNALRSSRQAARRLAEDRESERLRLDAAARSNAQLYADAQQANRRLAERQQQLETKQRELDAVLQGIADGVTAQLPNGRLLYANEAAARIMGFDSAADLVSLTGAEILKSFEMFDEHGQSFPLEHLPGRRALLGETEPVAVVCYRRHSSPEDRWAVVRATALRDELGEPVMAINVMEDITQFKALERQRGHRLAATAHDLRTPLTSAHGFLQLLRRRLDVSGLSEQPDIADHLARIEAAHSRLSSLLNDFLDLARLDTTGEIELNLSEIDLVGLLESVIAAIEVDSPRHWLHLESVFAPGMRARGDKARLERVIANLVENAVRYSPDGSEIRVRLDYDEAADDESTEGWASISIADEGIGIPQDDLERVFEWFERGSNIDSSLPGSGLGLAFVRQIIERHGGTIALESTPREGTTVVLRLPLIAPAAAVQASADSDAVPAS